MTQSLSGPDITYCRIVFCKKHTSGLSIKLKELIVAEPKIEDIRLKYSLSVRTPSRYTKTDNIRSDCGQKNL